MSHQLEDFIYKHGEELLRLAYTYVKQHEVAEDIVQDVPLKAYEQRSQFLGNAIFYPYIFKIYPYLLLSEHPALLS